MSSSYTLSYAHLRCELITIPFIFSLFAPFRRMSMQVAYQWATTALAPDLEAFQRHSKRSQIGPEDVLLAGRKNETTHQLLVNEAERLRDAAAVKKAPK